MLSSLYIHKIYAVRYAVAGQDSLGNFSSSSTPIGNGSSSPVGTTYNYIPCRIEEDSSKQQYNPGGERDVNNTVIYVPPQYHLQLQDRIYDLNAKYLGIVTGINNALKGISTDIDHYELIIENK